ncbi:hypothetical protein [Enterobacter hormaechei]
MKIDILPMLVTQVSLSENNDQVSLEEHSNTFSLNASVMFDEAQNTVAKLVANAELISIGKYEVNVVAEFVLHFDEAMTDDSATRAIIESKTEETIFPYVASYINAFIALSGYQRPNIPIVTF